VYSFENLLICVQLWSGTHFILCSCFSYILAKYFSAWSIKVLLLCPLSKKKLELTHETGTQYFLAGAMKSRVLQDNKVHDNDDEVVSTGEWFGCSTVPTPGKFNFSYFCHMVHVRGRVLWPYPKSGKMRFRPYLLSGASTLNA
jgi:hypothetical protein